jgi:diguanylate cyclase (GGDEF)-like protein/PAS domain S-box-containing protein
MLPGTRSMTSGDPRLNKGTQSAKRSETPCLAAGQRADGDATAKPAQSAKLKRADALMRSVVENSFDGILIIRSEGEIELANAAALRIFGYHASEIMNCPIASLVPELANDRGEGLEQLQSSHALCEVVGRRRNGTEFPMEIALSDTFIGEDQIFIAIVRDITERKAQQEQLEHQALHDVLTGLPNRTLLLDRLNHGIDVADRMGQPLGLLLLDLDRFKEINDTLGHHVGDMLLRDVAMRLLGQIRKTDTIARLGGDEFAVLLPAVTDLERARDVCMRILHSLEEPFQLGSLSLEVGVSIGIAMYPDHAEDDSKLLQCADVAMYAAKQAQSRVALYDPTKDTNTLRHLTLSGELRQAIVNKQITFHYQPKLDFRRDQITTVEALARWHHPTHGYIPPHEFVIQAEQTGLIQPLTLWEFDTALAQLAAWHAAGFGIGMAINLSARMLQRKRLPEVAAERLREWRVDPSLLTLEITESAIMTDPDSAAEILGRLDRLGLRLSIDDFGTGYSSLACLKQLPVDEIKIDRSFVMHMTENESDAVIVRSIIDLAHNLGLEVVAEGVESEQHLALLRGLGCDVAQGYFIARPMESEAFITWLGKSGFKPASTAQAGGAPRPAAAALRSPS